jgi:hypothetical protein
MTVTPLLFFAQLKKKQSIGYNYKLIIRFLILSCRPALSTSAMAAAQDWQDA